MRYFVAGGIFLAILMWFISSSSGAKNLKISSPLPDFLTIIKNSQVSSVSLFLPQIDLFKTSDNLKKLNILAKSALVYDLTTKKTLFAKNIDQKLPMASLTKIMTAIIALESKREDDKYLVSKGSLVGENSMGLSEGEVLSLEELLYGLILVSGNDASEVLAENYISKTRLPVGRQEFIKAMNDKAKSLGLTKTHFTNPSGLEGDGTQYSTAYDLLVMTTYALDNFPLFGQIVSTFTYTIPQTKTHKSYFLENETNLLTSYPGVKGVKTGYTPEAGLCLITYLDYRGHRIIGVLLGSNNRRAEMKELLDYSLKELGVNPPPHS